MKTKYNVKKPTLKIRMINLDRVITIFCTVILCSIYSINFVYGQNTITWEGFTNTNFGTASNWQGNKVPASGDNIIFKSNATNDCVLDKDRVIGSITNTTARNFNTSTYNLTINGAIAFTGAGKINATSTLGSVTFAGTSTQTLPASAFTTNTISNLYFANSALGGVTLNGNLTVSQKLNITSGIFSISSNTLTLNDSLKIVSGLLSGGTTSNLIIAGSGLNVTIPAITLKSLTLNRPNGLTLGGTMAIHDVLTLTSGTFTLGANTLNYHGTTPVVTAGLIDATNTLSKVVFLNSSPITFPVGLFRFYLNSLTMNGSGGIILGEDLTLTKDLELIDGKIQTDAYILTIGNTSNDIIGGNSNSYINGNCRKIGNTAFTFKIGNSDLYAPISISAANGGGTPTDAFTAKYQGTNPHPTYDSTQHESSIARISSMEYWTLDRTGTNNVSVTLSWDIRSGGVSTPGDLLVARWDGSMWVDHGNVGTTGDNISGTITSKLVSSFSPFTLASKNGFSNMLPITLLNFSAKCMDNIRQIDWSTASEINNNYFEIQQSPDAINWKTLGIIAGAGNSNEIRHYSYTDRFSSKSDLFYRLKSVDFDGTFHYSMIQYLNSCKDADIEFKTYPVPSKGIVSFIFSGDEEKIDLIEIYNLMGEIVYSQHGFIDKINLSDQAEGCYYVIVYYKEKRIIEKISIIK